MQIVNILMVFFLLNLFKVTGNHGCQSLSMAKYMGLATTARKCCGIFLNRQLSVLLVIDKQSEKNM